MRQLADAARIERFMRALGRVAPAEGAVYFTGGSTAVLLGWRNSTLDVDVKFDPDSDRLLQELPRLKNELSLNIELASPDDFIPVPSGWRERSLFAARSGRLSFYHFDFYAQALAKLERGHVRDLLDVQAMVDRKLVDPPQVLAYFEEIETQLYRYPALDPATFRRRVEAVFDPRSEGTHEG